MRILSGLLFFSLFAPAVFAQDTQISPHSTLNRPKLVVGIMVDQMRWDYLYRYYDRYGENGFKRMLKQGFSCENTLIPYALTVTAAGHASVYTGSVPAINGIVGNEWYDPQLKKDIYCVDDSMVKVVGGTEKSQPMSPKNLWTTTVCDELRLATNFRSKVIGIAMKDRGGILPAGQSANAAYWYDDYTGNWVTSTWYLKELPEWVKVFNSQKMTETYFRKNWNTLYPIESYVQSEKDNNEYEGKLPHEDAPKFPHDLEALIGKNYSLIRATPYGNSLTLDFSKAAIKGEQLGMDAITDFLAVSLSSTDYIGHQFGPNSIETEDCYLRLDQDLAAFFTFLDKEIGVGQYLVFLSADHGVLQVPAFLEKNRLEAGAITGNVGALNARVQEKFGLSEVIKASVNYQIYLDHEAIENRKRANLGEIKQLIISELLKLPYVLTAFDLDNIPSSGLPIQLQNLFLNSYNKKLGGDIQIVLKAGYIYGGMVGTTHGAWNPYDAHIPLLWMGWGIKPGKLARQVFMTDIAPTLSSLLHIQEPSGNIGKAIPEILN